MKKYRVAIICLMVLSLVFSGVIMMFLGEIIPIHFGADGSPDGFGSKYFLLIFSGIGVVLGVTMLLVSLSGKLSDNYKKYLLLTGVILQAIMLFFNVLFGVYALNFVEETPPFDISKVIMPIIGGMFILLSNFMPKIEKNRTLGLKTKWSMYNETTWQKTHRFTGIAGVAVGCLILILGMIFKEMTNFIILISLVLLFVILCTVASFYYYRQEKTKEAQNQLK